MTGHGAVVMPAASIRCGQQEHRPSRHRRRLLDWFPRTALRFRLGTAACGLVGTIRKRFQLTGSWIRFRRIEPNFLDHS